MLADVVQLEFCGSLRPASEAVSAVLVHRTLRPSIAITSAPAEGRLDAVLPSAAGGIENAQLVKALSREVSSEKLSADAPHLVAVRVALLNDASCRPASLSRRTLGGHARQQSMISLMRIHSLRLCTTNSE